MNNLEKNAKIVEMAENLDHSDMIGWTRKFPIALRDALTKNLELD